VLSLRVEEGLPAVVVGVHPEMAMRDMLIETIYFV
jgi:hypothetical protein